MASASWDWAHARSECLRVARRLAANEQDAEDIAHEALARAWRYPDRSDIASPSAWLARVTHNEAMRVFGRRTPLPAGDEVAQMLERARDDASGGRLGDPTDCISAIDLGRALSQLAPDERLLLRLRYECDLTQPAIAEFLAIPEGTAKVRLHRARSKLRELLSHS